MVMKFVTIIQTLVLSTIFSIIFANSSYAAEYSCNSCASCQAQLANAVSGDSIKLTSDLVELASTCISFNNKNGLIFDCQGHQISGPFSGGIPSYFFGFQFTSSNNNTLKNCSVKNFYENIRISSSSGNSFENITSSSAFQNGIFMQQSANNTISDSSLTGNLSRGVYVYSSTGNSIRTTTANSNLIGVTLDNSTGTTVDSLIASGNEYGLTLSYAEFNVIKNSRIENSGPNGGIYFAPGFNGKYVRNNTIYNNRLSNSLNFKNLDINNQPNSFHTNLDCNAGANIQGGKCVGGNFWTSPSNSGFSDSCLDADKNGICDSAYTPYPGNSDILPLAPVSTPAAAPRNLRVETGN
jgi:parallel beta-helix repeat protein